MFNLPIQKALELSNNVWLFRWYGETSHSGFRVSSVAFQAASSGSNPAKSNPMAFIDFDLK